MKAIYVLSIIKSSLEIILLALLLGIIFYLLGVIV